LKGNLCVLRDFIVMRINDDDETKKTFLHLCTELMYIALYNYAVELAWLACGSAERAICSAAVSSLYFCPQGQHRGMGYFDCHCL